MANNRNKLDDNEIMRLISKASNTLEAPSDSDLSSLDSEDNENNITQKEDLLKFFKSEMNEVDLVDVSSLDVEHNNDAPEDPINKMPTLITVPPADQIVTINSIADLQQPAIAGKTYIIDLKNDRSNLDAQKNEICDDRPMSNLFTPTVPSRPTIRPNALPNIGLPSTSGASKPPKASKGPSNKLQTKRNPPRPRTHNKGPPKRTLNHNTKKPGDQATWHPGRDNIYANNLPPFQGEMSVNFDGETPADFFNQMFPDEILELIATESIRYALEQGKHNFRVTVADLKIFFGINIIMTYIKYPNRRMYWSSISGLRMDLIANSMSINRFEEIKRYLHFVNNANKEQLKTDKFWKIRPIADILHRTFHLGKTEEENQSVDEMIVPFKGRSSLKQYLKKKPKKWGFKIWVKAGATGYVNCFELYQGASTEQRSKFGPVGDSVIRICHDIHGKNHKLFMDNYFTTLSLVRYLQSKAIFVLGTVQINRLPTEAKVHLVDPGLLPRGGSSIVTSSDNISVVRWMDSNAVHTISTYAGVLPEDEAVRWDRVSKDRLEVPRPYSIQLYNMFMGGVDLVDRMVAHYPHGLKNKRRYLRVFFHLMNVAIVNAWHLYKIKKGDYKYPLLNFKASLATSLIASGAVATKKRGRPSEQNLPAVKKRTAPPKISYEVRYDGVNHYPRKVEAKQAPRCHDKNCKSRTRYICLKCEEPVCPDCMESFHTK